MYLSAKALRIAVTLCASMGLALAASGAMAKSKNSGPGPADAKASPTVEALGTMRTAYALAEWAEKEQSAMGYAMAAKMLAGVKTEAGRMKPHKDTAKPPKADAPKGMTAAEMFKKAYELAGADEATKKAITALETSATAGTKGTPNPGCYDGYVEANSDIVYDEQFYGDEEAAVSLKGWSSDIDLWIYDENGNLICRSTDYGASEYCSFYPRWTGPFAIRVENLNHPSGSNYQLCTN